MTNKISKSTFKTKWGQGANTTFYHDIQFEGDQRVYNIGAKAENPAFLSVGSSLDWEWKDESKGSIKKAQKPFGGAGQSTTPPVIVPATDPLDIKVSTGLIAATILYAQGKIEKKQIDEIAANVARKFDTIKSSLQ